MSENYTLSDFVDKIDWEGGIYGALEYGLKSRDYDLPKEVEDQWSELRDLFNDMEDLVADFWVLVDKHTEA